MRQVFLDKGTIVVKEVCRPLLDDFSVLVSVHYSYISPGIESAAINGARQNFMLQTIPRKIEKVLSSISAYGIEKKTSHLKENLKEELQTLGFSCSGHVIAVGKKVKNFRTGDLVACAGAGFANHADIVCIPENLVARVHNEEFLKAASLTTLGAIALHGIRRANLQLGEWVCVWGLGLLGQIITQLAKCSGCKVIGVDILEDRLALAKENGAELVYNANDPEIIKDIVFATNQYGVDTTLISAATQQEALIQHAMNITRKKGRVILVGDVNMHVEKHPMYNKEIDLIASCSYGPGRRDQAYEQQGADYPYAHVRWTENRNLQAFVDLIECGAVKLDKLLTTELPLEYINDAYDFILKKKKLGVVIGYGPKKTDVLEQKKCSNTSTTFTPARRDTTGIGIVGIGGYARSTLLPIISRLDKAHISAFSDPNIARSTYACRTYKAKNTFASDDDLMNDESIDAIVITSPHRCHSEQTIRALQRGKAVLVDKPLVANFDQFTQLKKYLETDNSVPLCVNYNRSFSPYMQKIKETIQHRTSPLMISYRINAEPLANTFAQKKETGSGRIIGEACHIIDLFCYLTDSKPIALSVESLHSSHNMLFPTDNFSVQIRFKDGSICNLFYTSIGHERLGTERMELFYDNKTIVMKDYCLLVGYGLPSSFNMNTRVPDMGHEELITTFFDELQSKEFKHPIAIDRLLMVSHLSLLIDKLACEGGGIQEL